MAQYWYDHVHLLSPNPARTAKFYRDCFGARIVHKMPIPDGRTIIGMELKGSVILIMKAAPGTKITPPKGPPPLDHFGIATNDLAGALRELKAKGVKVTMEMVELVPKFFIAFVETPDGVSIELSEDRR
jgi:lactoylglutathione lyase